MIVAQLQPESPILSKSAEVSGDPLSDRLQSFPAGGLMGRMGSDEFARAVIDGDEDIEPLIVSTRVTKPPRGYFPHGTVLIILDC